MNNHDWVSMPTAYVSGVAYKWCVKCGTLRIEYLGENMPYEYFKPRTTIETKYGCGVGIPEDPGCGGSHECAN